VTLKAVTALATYGARHVMRKVHWVFEGTYCFQLQDRRVFSCILKMKQQVPTQRSRSRVPPKQTNL